MWMLVFNDGEGGQCEKLVGFFLSEEAAREWIEKHVPDTHQHRYAPFEVSPPSIDEWFWEGVKRDEAAAN